MPRKKTTTKKSKATKETRPTRRAKTASVVPQKHSAMTAFLNFLRLGESYTSLVLGIIVVIIATVLLLSVVHTRQISQGSPDATPTLAASNSFAIAKNAQVKQEVGDTLTPVPSTTPTKVVTKQTSQNKTYTVAAGDNLWNIAQKEYNSGYNWVDIAKANKLVQPGDIHVGDKLVIPQVTPTMIATVHTADDNMGSTMATQKRIMVNTYVVMHGDTLWDIAVQAYGDGYQWTKIAKANHLDNPGIIHSGNKLIIPRG